MRAQLLAANWHPADHSLARTIVTTDLLASDRSAAGELESIATTLH